jgi:hypothetical protein
MDTGAALVAELFHPLMEYDVQTNYFHVKQETQAPQKLIQTTV